ncbi:MAG: class I SAM-dependent methyltransferase, partial [Actinomycetota bacterium]
GVDAIIAENRLTAARPRWRFVAGDYTDPLGLPDGAFDLVVSLYAGFVSEHVARHLRPGGHLFANNSHGDASLAALDPRFELVAVVTKDGDRYRSSTQVDRYMIPKRGDPPTRQELRAAGRGPAFTIPAMGYVFRWSGEAG